MEAFEKEEEQILDDFFQPYCRLMEWEVDELKIKMSLLEKQILKHRHCDGKSFYQIGRVLNLPRFHVEKVYQHIVERLKKYQKLLPNKIGQKYRQEKDFSSCYCHRCGSFLSGITDEHYCMNCGWDEVTDPTERHSNSFYGINE